MAKVFLGNIMGPQGPAGADGADGKDGADGYTPVRGTDYWTDADIEAITSDVNDIVEAAITTALGGDY